MSKADHPFRYFDSSPEVIRLVMMYTVAYSEKSKPAAPNLRGDRVLIMVRDLSQNLSPELTLNELEVEFTVQHRHAFGKRGCRRASVLSHAVFDTLYLCINSLVKFLVRPRHQAG
ncbi:MAG: hypothetical protein RIQ99_1566, partial [Pseudomonadota bacterium]